MNTKLAIILALAALIAPNLVASNSNAKPSESFATQSTMDERQDGANNRKRTFTQAAIAAADSDAQRLRLTSSSSSNWPRDPRRWFFNEYKPILQSTLKNLNYLDLMKLRHVSKHFSAQVGAVKTPNGPIITIDKDGTQKTISLGQQWVANYEKIVALNEPFEVAISRCVAHCERYQNPIAALKSICNDYYSDVPLAERLYEKHWLGNGQYQETAYIKEQRDAFAQLYDKKQELEDTKAALEKRNVYATSAEKIQLEAVLKQYQEQLAQLLPYLKKVQPHLMARAILSTLTIGGPDVWVVDPQDEESVPLYLARGLVNNDGIFRNLWVSSVVENRLPSLHAYYNVIKHPVMKDISHLFVDRQITSPVFDTALDEIFADCIEDADLFTGNYMPHRDATIKHENLSIERYQLLLQQLDQVANGLIVSSLSPSAASSQFHATGKLFMQFLKSRINIYMSILKKWLRNQAARTLDETQLERHRPMQLIKIALDVDPTWIPPYQELGDAYYEVFNGSCQWVLKKVANFYERALKAEFHALARLPLKDHCIPWDQRGKTTATHEKYRQLLHKTVVYRMTLADLVNRTANTEKALTYFEEYSQCLFCDKPVEVNDDLIGQAKEIVACAKKLVEQSQAPETLLDRAHKNLATMVMSCHTTEPGTYSDSEGDVSDSEESECLR